VRLLIEAASWLARCALKTAYCPPPTAHYPLPTAYKSRYNRSKAYAPNCNPCSMK
jgi:hypothetical protein